jgi:Holliday junction resolvase-like predicted endonuclease
LTRGASIVGRNIRVGRGEIDLMVMIDGKRVAVEVKASLAESEGDPIFHFDDRKQRQVRALARKQNAFRVDYVGVELSPTGATIRWLPAVC